MRRIVTTLVAVLVAGGALAGPASATIRFKQYRGHLDDGGAIAVRLRVGANATRLSRLSVELTLTCDDATIQKWSSTFWWLGHGPALAKRDLSLDSVSFDSALHLHGTFGARRATGDLRYSVPMLTDDEQAQLCTTGDRTWTMRRIRSAGASRADDGASLDGSIRVRMRPHSTETQVVPYGAAPHR